MHWILSATPNYNLRNTLHQSEWLMRSPFLVQRETLTRIETLPGSRTFAVSVSQKASGLIVQTDSQLSGDDVEEVTERVRRVLRIDDVFTSFYEKAYETPALTNVVLFGAHTIRGTSVFEDIVCAVTATRSVNAAPSFHVTSWIVDRLGDSLPRNPTLHAFPDAKTILSNRRILGEMLPADLIAQLVGVADYFTNHSDTPALMDDRGLETGFVAEQMKSTFDLDNGQLALLMFNLGRYDYIPDDHIASAKARDFWRHSAPDYADDITFAFKRWQPWGGLAYWLWDWTSVPEEQHDLNRSETYG